MAVWLSQLRVRAKGKAGTAILLMSGRRGHYSDARQVGLAGPNGTFPVIYCISGGRATRITTRTDIVPYIPCPHEWCVGGV